MTAMPLLDLLQLEARVMRSDAAGAANAHKRLAHTVNWLVDLSLSEYQYLSSLDLSLAEDAGPAV